jgi:hypothetical protein
MTGADRWEWCAFRTLTEDGHRHRWGSAWRTWGVFRAGAGRFVVTHIPSGRRLTEFDRLAIARRFCERIDSLADWGAPEPKNDPALGVLLHRAALVVTGARPALLVVDGGAP